jgi:cytidylate kinase
MTAVAIDGPAGAGKSSVARAVAKALGYSYLDTGAMYRAIALAALEGHVDLNDETSVGRLARDQEIRIEGDTVRLNDRDVSSALRGKKVTAAAAAIAQHREVREALVGLQRAIASSSDVVMEGRDIGTEVLPQAEAKIFLTASLEERARRRSEQLGLGQDEAALDEIRADIERRDQSDRTRTVSPLAQASDAIVIDTTGLGPEQVVQRITEIVRAATGPQRR